MNTKKITEHIGAILGIFIFLGIFSFTTEAKAMTCDSATITGYVITNGNTTRARFTYSTTSSTVSSGGGSATSVQTVQNDQEIEQLLSGLSASTTYYYRIEVTNEYGTDNGSVRSFTTPACNNPIPPSKTPPSGSITSTPTCTDPCNVSVSWSSDHIDTIVRIFRNGTFIWNQTANISSSEIDYSMATGTYIYCIRGVDSNWVDSKDLACSTTTVQAKIITPVPTCQDTTATNYRGTLPCTYPAQTCQDTTATNYGGTLPCKYPTQTCQDTTAINYGGTLPCKYSAPTCQDPSATNYRGTIPCTYYTTPSICQDPSAVNHRGALPCVYPTPTCQDPSATNYRGTIPCTYPPQTCQDTSATNYRGSLPCAYPTQTCQDQSATNYRGTLPCAYYTTPYTCQDQSATNYRGTLPCTYPTFTCQDPNAINYRGTLPCAYPTFTCQDPNATNYRSNFSCTYTYKNTGPIPTVNIYADSSNLEQNGSTFIRWDTTNANSCYGNNGGLVGWNGPKSIGPGSFFTGSLTVERIYSITCSNNYGSATDSVSVNVRPAPIINTTTTITRRPLTSYVLITSSVDRNQPIVPTLDNTKPRPGDEINLTISYQNVGNGSINNLNLRIDLPNEVYYLSSIPGNPSFSGNTLFFNLGTLRANGQGTVVVRVKVRDNISNGTKLNFPATLSYTDPEGNTQSVNANVTAEVVGGSNSINLGANAFLAGNFFPDTIVGWMLVIIIILIIILLSRHPNLNIWKRQR
jgi:uncharacterized repeat protein (TIGR01451 family)